MKTIDVKDITGICADAGIVLAYLPPYSPDLNPIEEAVAQLKPLNRVMVTHHYPQLFRTLASVGTISN